ncbi:MAG: DUF885 domain-containing protein [bacterium]
MATPSAARSSAVDHLAERYLEASAALDPISATNVGLSGYDDRLTDYSPEGHAARAALLRATLREVDAAERDRSADLDRTDRITVAALRERLGLELERSTLGETARSLNVISSPVQDVRAVFDLMPTATAQDWQTVAARLLAVPEALAGYRLSLTDEARAGRRPARRQVEKVAAQCADYGGADAGFFVTFAAGADADGAPLSDELRADLQRSAATAASAYRDLGHFLRTDLLPDADPADAVGEERYRLGSRYFLGAAVDLLETYEWGQDELARIEAEMARVAEQIEPGADLYRAIEVLDADPARRIHGREEFRAWMQDLSDRTVAELGQTHFDIPEPIRRLDCRIAPTETGGIYYTPPSEDFSRPGAMWWSVPKGVEDFSTWREVTTVFHEGVPGHHLQCAQTAYRAAELNRWRRLGCWVSGHGEGWALYAERLMADLGHLDDPGARLGMLDGQAFRAARVVLDIGVHLQLPVPPELGEGTWDAERAWTFLRRHARVGEQLLGFELDRYLGWPGQAPSYKVGERIWLDLREQVRTAEGAGFDLTAFHRRALDVGSVGLDVLRTALLEDQPA